MTREEVSEILRTMSPERLIEITVDGNITGDVHIQEKLEKTSSTLDALQLWCELMLDTGDFDQAQYDAYMNSTQHS